MAGWASGKLPPRLVRSIRRGAARRHPMRLRLEPLDAAQEWIAQQRNFWAQRLQTLDDLLQAEDAAATTSNKEKKR